jgi:hypothetical protein
MASKEIRELIKYGETLGFTTKKTKTGHIMFTGFGKKILSGSTPSDFRVVKILRKNLRKLSEGRIVAKP